MDILRKTVLGLRRQQCRCSSTFQTPQQAFCLQICRPHITTLYTSRPSRGISPTGKFLRRINRVKTQFSLSHDLKVKYLLAHAMFYSRFTGASYSLYHDSRGEKATYLSGDLRREQTTTSLVVSSGTRSLVRYCSYISDLDPTASQLPELAFVVRTTARFGNNDLHDIYRTDTKFPVYQR